MNGQSISSYMYFWFGLPFGSPNPTSDLVSDDDDDDSNYVL